MLLTLLASASAATAADPVVDRILTDPRITESSGLAASRVHPGVLWTHNDSGDSARIFAIGRGGETVAAYSLAGQEARDWEAMAPGQDDARRPALFIGDIGDNSAERSRGILVHRVTEPTRLADGFLRPVSYRLRYPDGPHDAETLLVEPGTNRLYVVTKGLLGGGMYAAPAQLSPTEPNELRRIADVPPLITDGAFLPDGRFVLRDYGDAWLYDSPGDLRQRIELPPQEQGESLAVSADGRSLLVGSEGGDSEIWRIPLGERASGVTPATTSPPEKGTPQPSYVVAGAGAAAVIAAAAAGWYVHAWRNHRRRRAAP